MVRPDGFEPPTLCSEDRCSNPLSYGRLLSVYYSNRERTGIEVEPITSFVEANVYLSQFYVLKIAKYNLDNMKQLMTYLDNPQDKLRIIHVAGTSGKTSTAYYEAALLMETGKKIGLTASPIVDEINERVQINCRPLGEDAFCEALTSFSILLLDSPVKPTFFELMVAFAYWYFEKEKVDYAVIEVGLGGLKDATNVTSRSDKVCIITDIGYDHMSVLGNTLSEITTQKAGIISPNNSVFSYNQDPVVMSTLREYAKKQNAELSVLNQVENPNKDMPDYQYRNWALAYEVYKYLVLKDNLNTLTDQGLLQTQKINIPGRMDIRHIGDKILIMDGAHNTQKMQAFVDSFSKLYPGVKPAVLIAMRNEKEPRRIAQILSPIASRIITTSITPRQDLPIKSMSAEDLAEKFNGLAQVISINDQFDAFTELMNSSEKVLVITGSIYLLGEIRKTVLLSTLKG